MARRSRAFSANLSFFAFQDIITSVTGILILVVMMLVLQLKVPGLLPMVDPIPEIPLAELEKRIAEGLERIKEVEILRLKSAGENESDLNAQIADLKAGLELNSENAEVNEIRVQIDGLEKEIKKTTETTVNLTMKRDADMGEMEKIQGLITAAADDLAESKSASHIWLHKGSTDLDPLVVEVNEDKAILTDLSDPTKMEEWSAEEMQAKITGLAGRSNKESSYFVFFIRPQGIRQFAILSQIVEAAGFDVGFHPLDESTQLRYAPE